MPRLRQLVLAARDLAPAVEALRGLLDAPPPYADPGIGAFGLVNAVLVAGTDLVEVVSPCRTGTAAGRWLDRRGDGGYMLMVDGPPALLAADRLAGLGVREVHRAELPDVSDVHLHPKDVGGVLLALDAVDPPGSWRWAGPAGTGRRLPGPGGLRAVTIAVADPAATAHRWALVLDLPEPDARHVLPLGEGTQQLRFVVAHAGEGAVAATLALPVAARRTAEVAGTALEVVPLGTRTFEEEPT